VNFVGAALGPPARWLRRSPRARWVFAGTALAGAFVLAWPEREEAALPDANSADTPQEKKQAFIDYVLPYIREVNADILRDRRRLSAIRRDLAGGDPPGYFDARWLKKIAEDYETDLPEKVDLKFVDQLLIRVDAVPASLVLAQAAEESGWGTSRFARHGNNLFGMRAYDGKGLVPPAREAGEKFRVATYPTVRDSIADYINNLNTGENYLGLRLARRDLRRRGQPATGANLAAGLSGYSGRGANYVETIRALIASNRLGRYDS
jgi:Bax protein